ncbi:ryncolin-4-like [Anopheles merus]|uniref:ryncolin-4-like n=1 Tax=Anopheles merus TaxID=30066 RepID=UPI001BE43882|nr:ryncolin-4-like [Anopheles merus]
MEPYKVSVYFVLLFSFVTIVHGVKENNGEKALSGFWYEVLETRLDFLQYKLNEMELTRKEDQEKLDMKLFHHSLVLERLLFIINKLNQTIEDFTSKQDQALIQRNLGLYIPSILYRSCKEEPTKRSGKYAIQPNGNDVPYVGYCDQTTFGGGWLVFQYRFDGSVDFWRNWTEYRDGFGSMDEEFWLGNALKSHRDMKFSTKDRRNDIHPIDDCANLYKGAWWYNECMQSHLNGLYLNRNSATSIGWYYYKNSWEGYAYSRMSIREV